MQPIIWLEHTLTLIASSVLVQSKAAQYPRSYHNVPNLTSNKNQSLQCKNTSMHMASPVLAVSCRHEAPMHGKERRAHTHTERERIKRKKACRSPVAAFTPQSRLLSIPRPHAWDEKEATNPVRDHKRKLRWCAFMHASQIRTLPMICVDECLILEVNGWGGVGVGGAEATNET